MKPQESDSDIGKFQPVSFKPNLVIFDDYHIKQSDGKFKHAIAAISKGIGFVLQGIQRGATTIKNFFSGHPNRIVGIIVDAVLLALTVTVLTLTWQVLSAAVLALMIIGSITFLALLNLIFFCDDFPDKTGSAYIHKSQV